MRLKRKAVLDKLLSMVARSGKYQTYSRKVRLWTDVSDEEKPAVFITSGRESRVQDAEGTPPRITLYVDLLIYVKSTQQDVPPSSDEIEDRLDDLDNVLRPSALTGKQTLEGLVSHCWIEGDTIVVPGDLDGDGIAIVPIRIEVPEF